MKNPIILTVFLIALVSLCENFPSVDGLFPNQVQVSTLPTVNSVNSDIILNAEAMSSKVNPGRSLQVFFELTNRQSYDLRNVVVDVYDYPCFNAGSFVKNDCGSDGTLKANRSCMWSWKFEARSDISLETNCFIRFKTSYDADYSYFQDIAVLPEAEYMQKELEGTLTSVPVNSYSSSSPLRIAVTFSENQPFLENQKYYMYINYYNSGGGLLENTEISLNSPANIENLNCADYSGSGSTYQLNKELIFMRNEATPSTCDFTTVGTSTVNIKSLRLSSTYTYNLDNCLTVVVSPPGKSSGETIPVTPTGGGGGRVQVK